MNHDLKALLKQLFRKISTSMFMIHCIQIYEIIILCIETFVYGIKSMMFDAKELIHRSKKLKILLLRASSVAIFDAISVFVINYCRKLHFTLIMIHFIQI